MLRCIAIRPAASPPLSGDGLRVLMEGHQCPALRNDDVIADLWLEIGPSESLVRWYRRDPRRWDAFAGRYRRELAGRGDMLMLLERLWRRGPMTLLHCSCSCSGDPENNAASVLREVLEERALA